MRDGIPYPTAVQVAQRDGVIVVNIYDEQRMTRAVKRAAKKGLLKRVGGPGRRARFAAAPVTEGDGRGRT